MGREPWKISKGFSSWSNSGQIDSEQKMLKLWYDRLLHVTVHAVGNASKSLADGDFIVEK